MVVEGHVPRALSLLGAAVDTLPAPARRGAISLDGMNVVVPARNTSAVIVVFDAQLWRWDARRSDTWTFVSLPADVSAEIRDLAGGSRRGFGSLRVRVTIGGSTWKTSIFPASADRAYVLPIKRPVRTAEVLEVGDLATVTIELIDL
jgi:hypothetical protein